MPEHENIARIKMDMVGICERVREVRGPERSALILTLLKYLIAL